MELRHVGIVCKDLEESLKFYCDSLGCTVARRMHESGRFISKILGAPQAEVITVKLVLPAGNGQIELLSFIQPESNEISSNLFNIGVTHFALKVQQIDALYKKMKQGGISFLCSPEISEDGMAKVCFCQDPNGVYIELVEIIGTK